MLTEESGIGPERPRDADNPYLRQAACSILLDQLNDLSRYEIITPAILHHVELCLVVTVSSYVFGILLSVANIRPVDDGPAISLHSENAVIVGESDRGQGQTDGSQKRYTSDVSHIDFKIGKTAAAKAPVG
jgi:hypothetical protein